MRIGKEWRKKRTISRVWLILEAVIAAGVLTVWISLFFRRGPGGFLSSPGIKSLRYYTVLSNLAAGAASLCCVLSWLRRSRAKRACGADAKAAERGEQQSGLPGSACFCKEEADISRAALRFRFVGAVMALTTFMTVALFFLPLYGWSRLYAGENFWFHLVFPLLSMTGFFLIPGAMRTSASTMPSGRPASAPLHFSMKETLLPILPVLLYGACYSINILVNGKGTWPKSNDWYGFLHWGWGIGWCIFGGIILATWLAGMLMRAAYHKILAKTR